MQLSPGERLPEFGPEGKHFFSGIFFILGEQRVGGGARSAQFGVLWAQKYGCAQRTDGHARPKPTSLMINAVNENKRTVIIGLLSGPYLSPSTSILSSIVRIYAAVLL